MSFKLIPRINCIQIHSITSGGRWLLWTYFIGCPGLSVRPVEMVPDVPPLDLQWIRRYSCPSEGAGHLHILTSLSSHITGYLSEHGWTDTEGDTVNEQTQQWTNYSVAFVEKGRKLRICVFLFYFGARESRFSKIFNLMYMSCFGKAHQIFWSRSIALIYDAWEGFPL